ncbi:hypothetical protein HMPREF0724_13247 [Prescottella equi ATCC 33707]|uniref:Uncharacterized protein n=1 Tax=Prescottella equi ATCC 33707 TaxID=525370 RepID=E9T3K6_RHOHA|nr:hypothetical protein HMPREF0724_13247 [Prescottella equi ATCC 33707]
MRSRTPLPYSGVRNEVESIGKVTSITMWTSPSGVLRTCRAIRGALGRDKCAKRGRRNLHTTFTTPPGHPHNREIQSNP